MDDNAPKENPPSDFNKLDLTQLQGFSFGTQWTQDKSSPADRQGRGEGGDRPRRDDRREGGAGPGGPDRRDRRTFRRPAGPGTDAPAGAPAGGGGAGGERREFAGDRPPQRDGPGGNFRGAPRRDGPGGDRGAPRYSQGGYGQGGRGGSPERGPYESPYYAVTFYPEDTSFNTLVQTIRKSCRTVELFEIARTVVAKTDRFVVVVAHKNAGGGEQDRRGSDAGGARTSDAAAETPAKARLVFHISVPDGIPFESDEAAVAHVLSKHLDKFFETSEAEVEPPKGNFQVINKCGVTGELLGPPNYHRYNQIVQQHHAAKLASRMPLEAFRSRIETVRDPEVVAQWLAKMKKTTRFTWKTGAKPAPAASQPAIPFSGPVETVASAEKAPPGETAAPLEAAAPAAAAAPETSPTAEAPVTSPAPAAPATPTTPTFDTLEDARMYLLTSARDKVVRTTETARFHGKVAETMPPGEIRQAVEGALERQRRFPLDTANALRGRLRREHFTIFKKGSKGVSYVCAVKRKFRIPGQTFADSIGALIGFIETHPMIRASELGSKFLGLAQVAPAKPVEARGPATDSSAPASESPRPEPSLSIDQRAKLSRMQGDVVWLVREGYVTEFIDGRLFAPPPMVEARKKEVEAEEHDPENFPDVPATESPVSRPPAGEAAGSPAETGGSGAESAAESAVPTSAEPEPGAADQDEGKPAAFESAPADSPTSDSAGPESKPAGS